MEEAFGGLEADDRRAYGGLGVAVRDGYRGLGRGVVSDAEDGGREGSGRFGRLFDSCALLGGSG